MSIQNRMLLALAISLTAIGCGSSDAADSSTTLPNDGDSTNDSVTQGVTLSGTSADGSDSGTDASASVGPTTEGGSTTDPVTTDPSTTNVDSTDGGTTDADTSASGSSEGSSTTDPTAADLGDTIYEVQDGTIATDSPVEINGVVVTGVASNGVFVEEPGGGEFSGVFAFSVGGPDVSGAQMGDLVNLTGVVGEYMNNTEIDISAGTYELVDTGAPLDPDVVAMAVLADGAMAEAWEGVLVRVEGDLAVVSIAASNEFVVTDGADNLRIDDFLYELPTKGDFVGFDVDATFTAIQGPLNFFNAQYKIAARAAADFDGYVAP